MLNAKDMKLAISITGDSSNLNKALTESQKNIENFSKKLNTIGRTMSIVGSATTAALGTIVKKTADVGDKFDKMAARTGVPVEALSQLAYAAELSGTSIEGMENGLRKLASNMDDAARGTGIAADAFEELGINVSEADGSLRPTVEIMKDVATEIAGVENAAKQSALAADIFGERYGPQLLPLLKQGGQGIDELMEKADELNLTVSTESATAAAKFNDSVSTLQGSLAAAGRTIGDALIPALTPLVEKITEIVGRITTWTQENPELVATIVKLGATLAAAAAVGGPILLAASSITAVVTAISALASPIGLVIAAVAALAVAWATDFGGIKTFTLEVIDAVKEAFNNFVKFIDGVITKILAFLETVWSKVKTIVASIKDLFSSGGDVTVSAGGMGTGGVMDSINVASENVPAHATGIDYVPKTGLALIHQGEAVLNPNDAARYREGNSGVTFSPSINVTVQGDGDENKIKRVIRDELEKMSREFRRTGYELA